MLEARNITVTFRRPGGARFKALDAVSVSIPDGKTVGLVGESGSGKTTLVRTLCGLVKPDAGEIRHTGAGTGGLARGTQGKAGGNRVSMVFQDASGALDPRQRIGAALAETLRVRRVVPAHAVDAEVARLLKLVGLPGDVADKRPSEMSGGQCQRVCIARAIAVRPSVLIGDEPVSALDVSVQARILRLFSDLMGDPSSVLKSLFIITHDLAVVSAICDYVYVLEKGRVVEEGVPAAIFANPGHPYTRRLLAAVPKI